MRIALDATALLGPPVGVEAFTRGVLEGLAARDDTEVYGYGLSWRGRSLLREVLPEGITSGWSVPAAPLLRLWAHSDLITGERIVDAIEDLDVVHGTNFVVPPSRRAGRVVTVHDLTCVRFPAMCTRNTLRYPALIQRAVRTGAWVHTPSEAVAAEVREAFDVDADRVRAVHSGFFGATPASGSAAAGRQRVAAMTGTERYVLTIGTVEPRKDHPLLVRAFDEVADADRDLSLVIAGPNGWGSDALDAAVGTSRHPDRIVRTGLVEAEVKDELLAGAVVFAYPSVYEGFGFPPLEAMAAGVPVVATAAGAVPEVCGDAAVLVPVGDADALADALVGVLDGRGPSLVAAGRARIGEFTWSACAAGLMALYRDIG